MICPLAEATLGERWEGLASSIVRRQDSVKAMERLGKLCGLTVADPGCRLADRDGPVHKKVCCVSHPHRGQVLSEGGVPDLKVDALQLTPGRGNAMRDLVEAEIASVLLIDDRDGVREDLGAVAQRVRSVVGHGSRDMDPMGVPTKGRLIAAGQRRACTKTVERVQTLYRNWRLAALKLRAAQQWYNFESIHTRRQRCQCGME